MLMPYEKKYRLRCAKIFHKKARWSHISSVNHGSHLSSHSAQRRPWLAKDFARNQDLNWRLVAQGCASLSLLLQWPRFSQPSQPPVCKSLRNRFFEFALILYTILFAVSWRLMILEHLLVLFKRSTTWKLVFNVQLYWRRQTRTSGSLTRTGSSISETRSKHACTCDFWIYRTDRKIVLITVFSPSSSTKLPLLVL